MFTNIKNRLISAITPDMPTLPSSVDYYRASGNHTLRINQYRLQDKFEYARPGFLQLLTNDELRASADHNVRPIIVPRDINILPWGTGYAECVNSGKSEWNEDQAAFCRQVLSDPSHKYPDLPYTYFGIFDGHAGYGAALAASHQFHHILHEKLVDCIDMLLPRDEEHTTRKETNDFPHPINFQRHITKDELIVGALESAFFHMDSLIAQDRDRYRDAGGCTACVALFINGKLFVANAGDSRAVLCQRKAPSSSKEKKEKSNADGSTPDSNDQTLEAYPVPFSFDHTPETERPRLLNVAHLKPHLLAQHYAAMEYARRPHGKDLGQRILCRQGTMKGWTYKTLTTDDLRMPVVTGEGKRSRLLGTLGVTRGFGDHDLLAINSGILIKPFLTPHPDVISRDLSKIVSIPGEYNEDGDYGILVMATDGLWDVSENETVARTTFQTLAKYPTEKHRYTMVAQELVARARGKVNTSGHWRLADSKAAATVDDISVIVIPVYQYYKEHMEWEKKCAHDYQAMIESGASKATEAKEDQLSLLNGISHAHVEVENDEDEEDIVVSLHKDASNTEDTTLERETIHSSIDSKNISVETENSVVSKNDESKTDAVSVIVKETNDTTEAVANSETEKEKTPQSTPDKANKSKQHNKQQQQQQRNNRSRQDKR